MLVPAIAFVLLPVSALFSYLRSRLIVRSLGALETPFVRRLRKQFFGIMFCTPVLIALNYIRDFDLLVRIAVSGVGVLGFYIAFHDMLFSLLGGIYEKGIVWNGTWVLFEDIDFLDERDTHTLTFQMKDRTRKDFVTVSGEFRDAVIARMTEKTVSPES